MSTERNDGGPESERRLGMTNQAKPTPGPWRAQSDPCDYDRKTDVYSRRTFVASVQSGSEADAHLIAEAGTVYHETGLTPRQLAEQRAELLEALEDAVSHYGRPGGPWNVLEEPGAWITKARTAIAKARGGAA